MTADEDPSAPVMAAAEQLQAMGIPAQAGGAVPLRRHAGPTAYHVIVQTGGDPLRGRWIEAPPGASADEIVALVLAKMAGGDA